MNRTEHLELYLPEYIDDADISTFNYNMEVIDAVAATKSELNQISSAVRGKITNPAGAVAGKFLQIDSNGKTVWGDGASSGSIEDAVSDWLEEHVQVLQDAVIDDSLTIPGAAADAAVTGVVRDAVESITKSYTNIFDSDVTFTASYLSPDGNLNAETLIPALDSSSTSSNSLCMLAIPVKPSTYYAFPKNFDGKISVFSNVKTTVSDVEYYTRNAYGSKSGMTDKTDYLLWQTLSNSAYIAISLWQAGGVTQNMIDSFMIIEVDDPETFEWPSVYIPHGAHYSVNVSSIGDYNIVGKDAENANAIEAVAESIDDRFDGVDEKLDVAIKTSVNIFDPTASFETGFQSPAGALDAETLMPALDVEGTSYDALIMKAIPINENKKYAFPHDWNGRISTYRTKYTEADTSYARNGYATKSTMTDMDTYYLFTPQSNTIYIIVSLWSSSGITQADLNEFMIIEVDNENTFEWPEDYIEHGYYVPVGSIKDYDVVGGDNKLLRELNEEIATRQEMQGDLTDAIDDIAALQIGMGAKQNILSFDNTPVESSTNPVTSGGIHTSLGGKINKPISSPDGTNGQLLQTLGDGRTQWVSFAAPSDEQVGASVAAWLSDHPEATTSIEDGSVTRAKIADGVLHFVTPEMFGAFGDGEHDDAEAIQAAFDTGLDVYFSKKTYLIESNINVDDIGQQIGKHYRGNGCTILHPQSHAFCVSSAIPKGLKDCIIEGFNFESIDNLYDGIYVIGGDIAAGSNYLQECDIINCRFQGHRNGMYLGGYRVRIAHCYFISCTYGYVDDCVNYHIIENNFFIGNTYGIMMNIPFFTYVCNNMLHANTTGIQINGYENDGYVSCVVIGNTIRAGANPVSKHLRLYNAKDIVVTNNFIGDKATTSIEVNNCLNIQVLNNYCTGSFVNYHNEGFGKNVFVDGGYYEMITVGSYNTEIILRNVTTTLLATNTNLFPRTDRYITAENTKLVYNAGGTDGRLGAGVQARLKDCQISTPTGRYDIKTVGSRSYSLNEDRINNVLSWELIT